MSERTQYLSQISDNAPTPQVFILPYETTLQLPLFVLQAKHTVFWRSMQKGLIWTEGQFIWCCWYFYSFSFQGGNDYEIFNDPRTIGFTVYSPSDTARLCRELFIDDSQPECWRPQTAPSPTLTSHTHISHHLLFSWVQTKSGSVFPIISMTLCSPVAAVVATAGNKVLAPEATWLNSLVAAVRVML